MATITSKLHQTHEDLRAGLASIKETADLIDLASTEALKEELSMNEQFLRYHLLPHARAEEEVMYRAYDGLANSPWATDTMRHDHDEVERLTEELSAAELGLFMERPSDEQKLELRRVLYGLYAVLKLHFDKEEALLLPRLEDGLTQDAADGMLSRMEALSQTLRREAMPG